MHGEGEKAERKQGEGTRRLRKNFAALRDAFFHVFVARIQLSAEGEVFEDPGVELPAKSTTKIKKGDFLRFKRQGKATLDCLSIKSKELVPESLAKTHGAGTSYQVSAAGTMEVHWFRRGGKHSRGS